MKRLLIILALMALMLPIVAWAQMTGDTCDDPILLNLPVVNQAFDNEGMANDYTSGMFTGITVSTGYLNGNDWVGKVSVPGTGVLNITVNNQTSYSSQWMGVF
ncbi:MAG: hypothetical protein WCY84_03475 [Candidatus Cloacimonadaceae bacterium]